MEYYFELQIILPEDEQNPFLDRQLSKNELSEVTRYLQQKTSRGIPVKFRVGIFQAAEGKMKIMSVTLNTKNTKETDIVKLLINRVTDQDVLSYLNQPTEPIIGGQEPTKEATNQALQIEQIVNKEEKKAEESPPTKRKRPVKEKAAFKTGSIFQDWKQNRTKKSLFLTLFQFFVVLLIGMNIMDLIQQTQLESVKKKNQSLQEQIERVKESDTAQAKIDTFGRYFLTYYFAQETNQENYQSNLKPYLSDNVDRSDWKSLGKTLKSVNYYGSEATKKGYRVTYLVIVEADKHSKLQQITFEVEPTKNGFLVTTQPTLADFSFN